jgi:hypothetical protein
METNLLNLDEIHPGNRDHVAQLQTALQNSIAEQTAQAQVALRSAQFRPYNTSKTYKGPQKEYKVYCR